MNPNEARQKLEQLSQLADHNNWDDRLQTVWLQTLQKILPGVTTQSLQYFPAMLLDQARTHFYDTILKGHVKDQRVLEVGSGIGALAIMALKHGASHVVAIEHNARAAELAKETFRRNGVSERVTLIHKSSYELTPEDCQGCTVVLHELFGRDPFAELMHETLAHIRLLLPNAHFLPEGMRLKASILRRAQLPSEFQALPTNEVLDLSALERERKGRLLPISLSNDLWNEGELIFEITFKDLMPLESREESLKSPLSHEAAIVWFEIFHGEIKLTNWGTNCATHWGQLCWLPPTGSQNMKVTQSPCNIKITVH